MASQNYYAMRPDVWSEVDMVFTSDESPIVTGFSTIEELDKYLDENPAERQISANHALSIAERSGALYLTHHCSVPDCVHEGVHWVHWGTEWAAGRIIETYHLAVD